MGELKEGEGFNWERGDVRKLTAGDYAGGEAQKLP